jgi:cell division protein FtsL
VSSAATERAGARRIRFTPRAGVLGVVLIALLLYLVVPLRTYMAQRDRLEQLERQSTVLQQQNTQLQQQVHRLQDPAYLERIARECLGMLKPGEIGFIVVPKSGSGGSQLPGC